MASQKRTFGTQRIHKTYISSSAIEINLYFSYVETSLYIDEFVYTIMHIPTM
jgi:hypothetical protein